MYSNGTNFGISRIGNTGKELKIIRIKVEKTVFEMIYYLSLKNLACIIEPMYAPTIATEWAILSKVVSSVVFHSDSGV